MEDASEAEAQAVATRLARDDSPSVNLTLCGGNPNDIRTFHDHVRVISCGCPTHLSKVFLANYRCDRGYNLKILCSLVCLGVVSRRDSSGASASRV